MKTILVGIDFLDSSLNALEHAVSIANMGKTDILMVWVNRPEYNKEVFLYEPEKLPDVVDKKFQELITKYQPLLENGKISYTIKTGKVYKQIVKEAKAINAEMIVVGTHGSSGFEKFWIGSNANKIVSATDLPVITIRGGIDVLKPLTRILLPIDSTLETRQKVPYASYLAKVHDAEIIVTPLYTTKVETVRDRVSRYTEQVTQYLDDEEVKYRIEELEVDNLTEDTIDFAKKIGANLICIMTEQERSTANLWLGPYAQRFVNHSPIPILSIHAKDFTY
ncbi:MAG: universal stress protein [Bacteroidota bacterium]|nr:universal stress protein [Bacteroidota bacterium]